MKNFWKVLFNGPLNLTVNLSVILAVAMIAINQPSVAVAQERPTQFILTLGTEPQSLSPFFQRSAYPGFLYSQVHTSLLKYRNDKLISGLAQKCTYDNPTQITCDLRSDLKFSDGSPLTAENFVQTWSTFLKPATKALRPDFLFPIKNAESISLGKLPAEKLGVRAEKQKLVIELEKPNPEFIYHLASPLLSPVKNSSETKSENIIGAGAFKITAWRLPHSISLKSNDNFYVTNTKRPNLIFRLIEEQTLTLKLFESKEIDFVRRVPTVLIPQFKDRPDFHEINLARMDYFGFSKDFSYEERAAYTHAIDYLELQKLFSSKKPPGCFGIPENLTNQFPCLQQDPKLLKEPVITKALVKTRTLLLSQAGGDDHKNAGELIVSHWQKNLDKKVNLKLIDNKFFLSELKNKKAEIFRKGLNLERPTCLAAVEWLHSGHPENTAQIADTDIDHWIEELRLATQDTQKKTLCGQILKKIVDRSYLIPTGPIYFSVLVNPKWKNWYYSALGELDLSELTQK